MNTNSSKRCQVVSPDDNLNTTDVKKRKHEQAHQNSTSYANNKYDVQFYKMNAGKSFQNETFPNFDGSDEPGK